MLSYNLTELRKKNNMTQADMAKVLGVARTTYSSYEQGRRTPDAEIQNKIADFFNVSLDYLHGRPDSIPNWATTDDLVQLEDMLKSNIPMAYNGVELNSDDKDRINTVLTQVFWERLKKKK